MSYISAAFHEVCAEAKPAESHYVSLYQDSPFYGGPEEGGWWGHDVELVAYHEVNSDVEAKAVREQVEVLAEELSRDAKDSFNRGCAASVEWVEQHDPMAEVSDYFPEVDGEVRYFVAVESTPGSCVSHSSRHYE